VLAACDMVIEQSLHLSAARSQIAHTGFSAICGHASTYGLFIELKPL
jgi:hypothetical protein